MHDIQTIAVVGAGAMGTGIAHVFARSGFDVLLCDLDQRVVETSLARIRANLEREAAKGKLRKEEVEPALGRIRILTDQNLLATAIPAVQICIEAASERFETKSEIFRSLDAIMPPETILATNTSSISVTKLAALTARPAQVVGMHFFNPVPVMELVEIIRGMATDEVTFGVVRHLALRLGKTPIEVNDSPGFVSNRVLMPLINEAAFTVMEGVATAEAVDQVFQLGMAHPMGPLTLADFIGLDVCVDILRVLHQALGDPKFRPCPLLVRMVDAGWLGRKSGRGFYRYQ